MTFCRRIERIFLSTCKTGASSWSGITRSSLAHNLHDHDSHSNERGYVCLQSLQGQGEGSGFTGFVEFVGWKRFVVCANGPTPVGTRSGQLVFALLALVRDGYVFALLGGGTRKGQPNEPNDSKMA
jgi:hypothetical protein